NMADAIKAGEDAHHIVQSTHPRAEAARKLLDKYQIDINDAVNGVGLRPTGPKPAHHGHGLHSHDAIDRVTDRLNRAVDGVSDWTSGRQALLDALSRLKSEIAGGKFP
ncbi:MAG: AHH domain-containing protein, partial [Planctomycetaceae bacterium]